MRRTIADEECPMSWTITISGTPSWQSHEAKDRRRSLKLIGAMPARRHAV
jgi:hypothetical protein